MYLFTYSINEMENSSPYVNVCFGNNLEHQSKPKATLEFVMTGVDFTFLNIFMLFCWKSLAVCLIV